MAGKGWGEGVSVWGPAPRCVQFMPGRRALGLLVLLLPAAAFALWAASGAAHACDPVTGEGCDTVPPSSASTASTAATPSTQPPETQAPQTRAPSGSGPVVPTTEAAPAPTAAAPTAPPTTLAPPTTAADEPSTKSDSGGGGVPWPLAAAVPAVLAGAAGVGTVVLKKKKSDPVAAYSNTCNDLCWLKQQEAQKQAEMDAIQGQLAQIDEAWRQARDYLRDQLRADYIAHKQKRALATTLLAASTPLSSLVSGVGFSLSIAMHGTRSQWYGYFSPAHWNKQVNDELISGQALVDGIHNEKRATWEDKLSLAKTAREEASDARQRAKSNLDALRAQNPDVTFAPCECA
jgi:hypothetical protein